jgi:hypothetical protein
MHRWAASIAALFAKSEKSAAGSRQAIFLEPGSGPMLAFVAFIMGALMTKEQEEQGFKVTDKRGSQEEHEPVVPEASEKTEAKPTGETSSKKEERPPEQEGSSRPPIDFPSYILSYYTQGMVLLGEVPNPYTNKKEEDVEAAHHMIDILSMLEQKTKGNLSKDEQQLLESVIYELRIKYMAKINRIKL